MEQRASAIADDFVRVAALAGLPIVRADLSVKVHSAPHVPPKSLPAGMAAVYVFLQNERCLKVGKAGPRSSARFCNHHYGTNAPSTLAKSLLNAPDRVGLTGHDIENIRGWICLNTARIDFLLPAAAGPFALGLLELFVQCRLSPEFEGFERERQLVG